ncbi:MAG TPA: cupin domain-containing protein [Bryobacteraceae bacterium]|nr:cupin domain-containing protein [Bryobacteraceae bacterium]
MHLGDRPSLEWLIDPTGKELFFKEYWEKRPLVVRRQQPDYFDSLLSLNEVDRVITTLDRRCPDVTLKNALRPVAEDDYTTGGALDVAKVYQLFGEGSTIMLAYLDTVVPALTLFCRCLENEFSCPFQTNVYLTPAGAQGAKPHYDTHDVFVLQVAGSKRWTIYGKPVELPLPGQDFDASVHPLGEPTQEFELTAGDVAYIPRGVAHDAHSTDDVSLHITAGVLRYTWADLLLEFVAGASLRDPVFRKALPPGFAKPDFDKAQARETLLSLLRRAEAASNFDAVLDHFVDEFITACPPLLNGQMAQVTALEQLTIDSIVSARPGINYRLQGNDESEMLECYGRRISFPLQAAEAMRFALSHVRFLVSELPGNLDDSGKLILIRRLIREGLVYAHA